MKLKDVISKEDKERLEKIEKNVINGNIKKRSKVEIINKSIIDSKSDFQQFCPITKVDEEQRMVYGIATKEGIDSQDEIVEYDATKKALNDYSKFRNLREMHKDSAVGVVPFIEWVGSPFIPCRDICELSRWRRNPPRPPMRRACSPPRAHLLPQRRPARWSQR